MNKYTLLLLALTLPATAADRVFTGSLERLTPASLSIRVADGLTVAVVLPAGIAVPYHLADQVEIACATLKKPFYDAPAGLHDNLQLKSIRLLRPASPAEQDAMIDSLSWRTDENLLQPPRAPLPAEEPGLLDRVRQVNLDYVSKLPDFVADEIARRYRSYDLGKPWALENTLQAEIMVKDYRVTRQNIRKHASSLSGALEKPINTDFGLHLEGVFNLQCLTKVEFAGRREVDGKPMLVYVFHSPPGHCFGDVVHNGNHQVAAVTGRLLVDPANLHVLRCEWEGTGFPETFAVDRYTMTEQWAYATIGGSTFPVPVSVEGVVRMSDGSTGRGSTEYKNHRHFEAATKVTFH